MFKIIGCLPLILAFMIGCNSSDNDIQLSQGDNLTQEHIQGAESLDKASYAGLEDVFLDTKQIKSFDGKLPLLIFGRNNCTYCEKLKDDIKDNPKLKQILQDHFSSFYINMSYTKTHEVSLGKTSSTLNTDRLANMFFTSPIRPTPTLIFLNQNAEVLYRLPGYIPSDKLLKVFTFIAEKKWLNLPQKQILEQISALIES